MLPPLPPPQPSRIHSTGASIRGSGTEVAHLKPWPHLPRCRRHVRCFDISRTPAGFSTCPQMERCHLEWWLKKKKKKSVSSHFILWELVLNCLFYWEISQRFIHYEKLVWKKPNRTDVTVRGLLKHFILHTKNTAWKPFSCFYYGI